MGAGESIPRELTHEQLFARTQDTRHVMNLILQYMLKEVTVKDFLALSNPNECKKYVLFMANTLHRHFYELRVQPTRNSQGVIAFRSVRDLAEPSTEELREKQGLCLVLAYYYTRIFQIYGALALTLVDDISTMRETGILVPEADRSRLVAPGQRQVMYGGTISDAELGRFAFLKDFLLEERHPQHGYRTKFYGLYNLYGEVFFKVIPEGSATASAASASASASSLPPSDPMRVTSASALSRKGVFTFRYDGATYYSTIGVHVDTLVSSSTPSASSAFSLYRPPVPNEGIRMTLDELMYYKKQDASRSTMVIPTTYMERSTDFLKSATYNGQSAYRGKDGRPVFDLLQEKMYRVLLFTKTLVEQDRTLTTPAMGSAASSSTSASSSTTASSSVLSPLSVSETNVVEELRLGRIINNLSQVKPYGHCIARALQLLDSAPFPNQPAVSHICKAKFLEVSGASGPRYSRSGIPEPGVDLTSSPGLEALSFLFYDTVAASTPKLTINQQPGPRGKSSLQQYVEFMRRLAIHFGDNRGSDGSPRTDDSLRDSGLRGIRNRRDKELCRDISGDISVPPEVARQVYGVVRSLFQTQLQHAQVCGELFRMLFQIQREPSSGRVKIALHENVLRGGVEEINRINFLAREQLMKYYSHCENQYVQGMKLVLESKRRPMAPAAPLLPASAPPPSAPPPASAPPAVPASAPLPSAPPAPLKIKRPVLARPAAAPAPLVPAAAPAAAPLVKPRAPQNILAQQVKRPITIAEAKQMAEAKQVKFR